jgi:hypothetical protein
MWWHEHQKISFKQSVAQNTQALKHRPAEDRRIEQRRAVNVFDDVRTPRSNKHVPDRLNEAWPFVSIPVTLGQIRIGLARRRCMNRIERGYKRGIESHGIGLDECKRVVWLRYDVHTYNLEAGSAVSQAGAPSATEKIKQTVLPSGKCHLYSHRQARSMFLRMQCLFLGECRNGNMAA